MCKGLIADLQWIAWHLTSLSALLDFALQNGYGVAMTAMLLNIKMMMMMMMMIMMMMMTMMKTILILIMIVIMTTMMFMMMTKVRRGRSC